MNTKHIIFSLSLSLAAGGVFADDDCNESVSGWQPRENLREQLEGEGWTVFRIKVDDGCYEVKGLDANGDRVEAEFSPGSFELMDMEWEDDDDDDDDDREYGEKKRGLSADFGKPAADTQPPANGIVKSRPTVTVN